MQGRVTRVAPGDATGSNLAVPDDYVDPRLTERRNPRSSTIDTATALEIVDLIGAEDATVPAAVAKAREEIARAIDLIEAAFRTGGRLLYVGAGTSGRLGVLDAAECPPTFGSPPEMVVGVIAGGLPALIKSIEGAEDDVNAGIGEMDARRVGPNDVVVGIAASGTTPYVRAALSRAQTLGARTALVSMSEPSRLLRETCDVCIVVPVGPEIVTGSTRMKSGTATKLVLNTLTTGAMIRLGKIYGNLMVDLRAWNDKLVDRSQRILMETTGLGRDESRAVLEASGGSVKTAIVMARRGVDRAEAERLLEEHAGRLRSIVGDPPPIRTA
jgi:N-acetylmuramic acid 6-phosphate etherase